MVPLPAAEGEGGVPGSEPGAARAGSEQLTDDEILKALDGIPVDFRSVVLLVDVEEFAYKEVAEILAIPIGTVMSRLSRGRGLLRKRLDRSGALLRDREERPREQPMIQTRFDERACRQAQARLDSYIDNELITESNLEMMQHFQRCPECNREAGERRKLRAHLQTAVREVRVPADLEGRVRDRLREARRPHSGRIHLMAIAAAIALCFGSWIGYQRLVLSSPAMSAILRIGLGDHVHCAVLRQGAAPAHAPIDKLTGEYKDLLPVVRQHIPADLPFVLAHKCEFQGRSFVHLTFRAENGLLSLIITHKQPGESLGKGVHTETVKNIPGGWLRRAATFSSTLSPVCRDKRIATCLWRSLPHCNNSSTGWGRNPPPFPVPNPARLLLNARSGNGARVFLCF